MLGGQFEAGDSITVASEAGSAQVPAGVGESTQEGSEGFGFEGVASQDLGPYDVGIESGGEVGRPQGDQAGDVVGLAGQGVDAAQEETRPLAPPEVGVALGDQAGQQPPVLEQPGGQGLRLAELHRGVGSGGYGQAVQGEPALAVLDERGGFLAFGRGVQHAHLVDGGRRRLREWDGGGAALAGRGGRGPGHWVAPLRVA
ncbi:hypothetical protein [Streptomyces variabilis]